MRQGKSKLNTSRTRNLIGEARDLYLPFMRGRIFFMPHTLVVLRFTLCVVGYSDIVFVRRVDINYSMSCYILILTSVVMQTSVWYVKRLQGTLYIKGISFPKLRW
jgi:hypothetical protein